jgi:hypothetical protein
MIRRDFDLEGPARPAGAIAAEEATYSQTMFSGSERGYLHVAIEQAPAMAHLQNHRSYIAIALLLAE